METERPVEAEKEVEIETVEAEKRKLTGQWKQRKQWKWKLRNQRKRRQTESEKVGSRRDSRRRTNCSVAAVTPPGTARFEPPVSNIQVHAKPRGHLVCVKLREQKKRRRQFGL